MTPQERTVLINQYKAGVREVLNAIEGISEGEMDFRRAPGKWSAREILHHLADSETTSAIRLRRLLVEDHPLIQGYDQDLFAQKLQYAKRPMQPAVQAFESARTTTAQILDFMKDEDWKRTGEHSESGAYSAETWLSIYAAHAHNHANQIRQNRSAYRERK